MKKLFPIIAILICQAAFSQSRRSSFAETPPMGWMTWNLYGEHINEDIIRRIADAMDSCGMIMAGYRYLIIDDGWQGGRDNRNNIPCGSAEIPIRHKDTGRLRARKRPETGHLF